MYIRAINLRDDKYKEYANTDNKEIILDKLNVFIGKNNSGKSRLMRQLLINEYEADYYFNDVVDDFIILKELVEELVNLLNDKVKESYQNTYLYNQNFCSRFFRSLNDEYTLGKFITNLIYYESGDEIIDSMRRVGLINSSFYFKRDENFPRNSDNRNLKERIARAYIKILNEVHVIKPKTFFFPSILSLRKLNNIDSTLPSSYQLSLSRMYFEDYFSKLKGFESYIKTGQEFFSDVKRLLLGLNKDRERFVEYEKYISDNFFDNDEVSIFITEDDNEVYLKFNDEKEYPIYELGDGLQTLLIITFYLFMNSTIPIKLFIDEPEIHLHPGMQRLLISKLLEFDNVQIFISTHSSSMIDICDNYDKYTSIICVEKNAELKAAYNSAYDDMNLYSLIGVRPSSIILSNCTIWVEGPTDVFYIEAFLKMYILLKNKKDFYLGYNYNYAFNGGINIASKVDFDNDNSASVKINKLSKNNFVIFDNDNLSPEDSNYKKIIKIKRKLGPESSHVVDYLKTIENLISPDYLFDYFNENLKNTRDKKRKKYILDFFMNYADNFDSRYYVLDIPDNIAEYICEQSNEYNIEDTRKYCNNLWNRNKYNLAVSFSNFVNNLEKENKEILFDKLNPDFIRMIKKIYKFINNNN